MTVAQPSTPASHFHLLRRQAHARPRRPLVVFTPKSMLRLKAAASPLSEFTAGSFRPMIGSSVADPAAVRRVLLCAGKVYYDLAARRQALLASSGGATDVAIVRVERLYPLPVSELLAELARYPGLESVTWVQEEPANMGAWPTFALKLPLHLGREVGAVSLPASSAPAAGSAAQHAASHTALIETAIP